VNGSTDSESDRNKEAVSIGLKNMFRQLVTYARSIRSFLGLAAFVVLALLVLFLFLSKKSSLDFGKLSSDQVYNIVVYGFVGLMGLLLSVLALSFIDQRKTSGGAQASNLRYASGELPAELSKPPGELAKEEPLPPIQPTRQSADPGMKLLSTDQCKFMSEEYITRLAAKLQLHRKSGDRLSIKVDDEEIME
jgi:hypothetical protein